mgnify:FL=1
MALNYASLPSEIGYTENPFSMEAQRSAPVKESTKSVSDVSNGNAVSRSPSVTGPGERLPVTEPPFMNPICVPAVLLNENKQINITPIF